MTKPPLSNDMSVNELLERARAFPDFPPHLKLDLYGAADAMKKEIRRLEDGGRPDDYEPVVERPRDGDLFTRLFCYWLDHKWRKISPNESFKYCARCGRREYTTSLDRRAARHWHEKGY